MEEDEVIIFIELKETMLVLYVVSGVGGLMLICLLLAFIFDRRHRKKVCILQIMFVCLFVLSLFWIKHFQYISPGLPRGPDLNKHIYTKLAEKIFNNQGNKNMCNL